MTNRINYSKLPNLIKDGVQAFTSEEEKMIFLTSAITSISACFPTISGIYDHLNLNANLYSLIVAPAASGKSVMKYGKQLTDEINDSIRKKQNEMGTQKEKDSEEAVDNVQPIEKKQVARTLIIPGDSSYAAMVKLLNENDPNGNLLVETEADTLSQVLKKEYGSFSDLLRKAYQHEPCGRARSTDNEFLEVKNPRLSVLLSGTPKQVGRLIPNTEDGLFSRFIFYRIDGASEWKDVSPNSAKPIYLTISPLALRLKAMYETALNHNYFYQLTKEQWDTINKLGKEWLKESIQYGADAESIAKRMGLILYRISMTLSIVRHLESEIGEGVVQCLPDDFESAKQLAQIYFKCSIEVYNRLNKFKSQNSLKQSEEVFLKALPDLFDNKQRNAAAKSVGINEKTGRTYVQALIDKGLIRLGDIKNQWVKQSNESEDEEVK